MIFSALLLLSGDVLGASVSKDIFALTRAGRECNSDASKKLCEDGCLTAYENCENKCSDETIPVCSECYRAAFECIDWCPCHDKCPGGCSECEHWSCGNHTILILNTQSDHIPTLMDMHGELTEIPQFSYDYDTSAYHSCSTVLNGNMYIFGGQPSGYKSFDRQITIVEDCGTRRIGSLPWSFEFGTCNTFVQKYAGSYALLCFAFGMITTCHTYDGKDFSSFPSSNFDHSRTTLGNLKNIPVAIGDYHDDSEGDIGSIKVETFSGYGQWQEQSDYPFATTNIYHYSTVTYLDELYIFGGYYDYEESSIVAKLSEVGGQWSRLEDLFVTRKGHRSILMGNQIFHLGGPNIMETERWTMHGKEITAEQVSDDRLNEYKFHPESFLVEASFCD